MYLFVESVWNYAHDGNEAYNASKKTIVLGWVLRQVWQWRAHAELVKFSGRIEIVKSKYSEKPYVFSG